MLPKKAALSVLVLILLCVRIFLWYQLGPISVGGLSVSAVYVISLPANAKQLARFSARMHSQRIPFKVWPGVQIESLEQALDDPRVQRYIRENLISIPKVSNELRLKQSLKRGVIS
jgi:hypothetical protein